jgi:hypothetical protein
MPTGRSLMTSAVLLELGAIGLPSALIVNPVWTPLPALIVVGGIVSFVNQVRQLVRHKLPPPAALPRPDWATWQTHVAFMWLVVAAATGFVLTLPVPTAWTIALGWIYGTAGLVGFLAQIVLGIQGRLLPMYGWYLMMERAEMRPPSRSAHTLVNPTLARAILLTWATGVPLLIAGLTAEMPLTIAIGSALLLVGVGLNAAHAICLAAADPSA